MAPLTGLMLSFVICFVSSMNMKKQYDDVRNNGNVTVLNLPITFFTYVQLNANTDQDGFILLPQCDGSTAMGEYAVLTIISPSDVSLNPLGNYPVVEVSTVIDVWNSSTVIGTNYYFDESEGVITTLYSNITWVYPLGNQVIYIRYRAYNADVSISLQLSYTNDAAISPGTYDKNAFKGIQTETGKYDYFQQFVKASSIINVPNLGYSYFYINFCSTVYPFIDAISLSIIITTTSLPTSPLSATTVSACPKSQVQNAEYCITSNSYAQSNQCGCNVNTLQLTYTSSTVNELSQGLYISIVGEGASPDNQNQIIMTIGTSSI